MLNLLCNHQQQPWVWKINCTLAKGEGNCFARYTTKSCLWAICQMSLQKKKKSISSLHLSHSGLLWTEHKSRNKEMSKRVRSNPVSMPKTETAKTRLRRNRQMLGALLPPEVSKTAVSADSNSGSHTTFQRKKSRNYWNITTPQAWKCSCSLSVSYCVWSLVFFFLF